MPTLSVKLSNFRAKCALYYLRFAGLASRYFKQTGIFDFLIVSAWARQARQDDLADCVRELDKMRRTLY